MGWFSRKLEEKMAEWDKQDTKELMPIIDQDFSSDHDDPESLDWFYKKAESHFGEEKAAESMPNIAAWRRITK